MWWCWISDAVLSATACTPGIEIHGDRHAQNAPFPDKIAEEVTHPSRWEKVMDRGLCPSPLFTVDTFMPTFGVTQSRTWEKVPLPVFSERTDSCPGMLTDVTGASTICINHSPSIIAIYEQQAAIVSCSYRHVDFDLFLTHYPSNSNDFFVALSYAKARRRRSLSVCPSQARIESKLMIVGSCAFYRRLA